MSPPDHPSQTAVSKYKTIALIFVLALAGYLIAVPASPPKHQSSTATSTATYTSTATNTATPVSGQWPVTVGADPAWLAFSVDAVTYYTPTTFNWDVNSQHTISTVSPQAGGRFESRFRFNNWSDGTSTPTVTPTLTGTASPRPTEPPQTYANFAPICTTAGSPADLYPSTITVSGVTNSLGNLRVLLYGVTHQVPDDLDVLLVAPSGEKFILMADAGGTTPIGQPGIDLTFSDSAGQILPDSMAAVTGLYEYKLGGRTGEFSVTRSAGAIQSAG